MKREATWSEKLGIYGVLYGHCDKADLARTSMKKVALHDTYERDYTAIGNGRTSTHDVPLHIWAIRAVSMRTGTYGLLRRLSVAKSIWLLILVWRSCWSTPLYTTYLYIEGSLLSARIPVTHLSSWSSYIDSSDPHAAKRPAIDPSSFDLFFHS